MPTIRDVAREAGVSIASASRALNGLTNVTAEMRERVWAAANKLKFVPHSGARSLTRRKSDAIGVILPDLFGEFFSEVVRGIDRVAHQAGMQMLLGNMHGNVQETITAIRTMRGRVDGLLVMPSNVDMDFLANSLPPDVPTVLLNQDGAAFDISSVAIDNHAGAYQMTSALLDRGYKRIVHIAGPKGNGDAEERQRGFADAMSKLAGNKLPAILPGDFTEESGAEAARLIMASEMPVDAIFAANDMMALGCMMALADLGVAVPGKIAVAGFDDIPLAHYVAPSLTTMQVHMEELGETAATMLLDIIRAGENSEEAPKQRKIIVPELITRQSAEVALS